MVQQLKHVEQMVFVKPEEFLALELHLVLVLELELEQVLQLLQVSVKEPIILVIRV
jgi:hypothetical protein